MGLKGIIAREEIVTETAQKGAKWLRSKYAEWWLVGISFAESMFAPILIDPFLIALILANRARWLRYVTISVIASVLGGLAGYALGAVFFETVGVELLAIFGLEDKFTSISKNLDENGFVFVLIGAFTPIPYKLVALASGLVQVNIFTFIIASIVGRILRLGLVGFDAYAVGPHALPMIQRHLHKFEAVIGLILIAYILYELI